MTTLLNAVDCVRRLCCAHEDIFRRENGHLRLECIKCSRQTEGIAVSPRARQPEVTRAWSQQHAHEQLDSASQTFHDAAA